ncbi:MAG: ABC-F family ATP-binding cassette domain-containing protein [Hungatella sp.]|nr:ABC-F family ATP-binding cassette domain-containing protein [Hungatella sp.]
MSLIRVSDLSFAYEDSYAPVFEHVSFQIDTDWKLGFTGRNGRGKTTFLRLLQGQYEYGGSIEAGMEFDYFPFPVHDFEADTLEVILGQMPDVEFWQLKRELGKLHVKEEVLYRPMATLSCGERTKVLLAALFSRENRFLLIDEPTNHLDMQGREILGEYLNQKKGFILVSHDRAFLDSCVDHMISINKTDIQVQKGNFSVWYHNKEQQDAFEAARQDRLKKEIGRLRQAAAQSGRWGDQVESTKIGKKSVGYERNRDYVGEKSRRMQQRRKNLERRQERAIGEKKGLLKNLETAEELRLDPVSYHKEVLVTAKDLTVGYGENQACLPVSFQIKRGETVLLCGANGCGKSSVMKAILAEAYGSEEEGVAGKKELLGKAPARIGGLLEVGKGLKISWIPQDTSCLAGSLEDYAEKIDADITLMKALLRKLDFSRELFGRPLESYSEGQKKKVLIGGSLCQKAHLYVWDEPLNYIDIYSRMQIEELIRRWKPTLLCVEHDRAFGEAVGAQAVFLA